MAYRFASPAQVFMNLAGTAPIPGGTWHFYQPLTTTPKTTYSDPDGTIPNSNPVLLDASARLDTEVWLDGDYTAELRDAENVVVWNGEITSGQAAGLSIPALAPGFLTNDLSNLSWQEIRQLPDPTGSAGQMVVTDGELFLLQPIPEPPPPPDPSFVITTNRIAFTDDDGNKMQIITGTGVTNGTLGQKQNSGTVTYATPFSDSTVKPVISLTGDPLAPGRYGAGYLADVSVSTSDANGFTFKVNSDHGEENADGNMSGQVTVTFIAVGPFA